MKKCIIINASPRKNWNTALLLKEAQKGAEAVGAETEYVDLYDLRFTGCRSCLACKRRGAERCKCYWKDDLSPLIDRILQADSLILGSPIYLSEPTAQFRALFERLIFCVLSYDGGAGYFEGKLNVGLIYTMNAPRSYYESELKPALGKSERVFARFFHGEVRTLAACETLQVNDYGAYNMGMFDPAARKAGRETQFPKDLQEACRLGEELNQ